MPPVVSKLMEHGALDLNVRLHPISKTIEYRGRMARNKKYQSVPLIKRDPHTIHAKAMQLAEFGYIPSGSSTGNGGQVQLYRELFWIPGITFS